MEIYLYPGTSPKTLKEEIEINEDCGVEGTLITVSETSHVYRDVSGVYSLYSHDWDVDNFEVLRHDIQFQSGDPSKGRNGFYIEDLIAIARDKLDQHQSGPHPCNENAEAIELLTQALAKLDMRVSPIK